MNTELIIVGAGGMGREVFSKLSQQQRGNDNTLWRSHIAVTAWEVLENLAVPRDFLKDIYRILKPGGTVSLSTPNWQSSWERGAKDDNRRPPTT